jgi:hypothetical protein
MGRHQKDTVLFIWVKLKLCGAALTDYRESTLTKTSTNPSFQGSRL